MNVHVQEKNEMNAVPSAASDHGLLPSGRTPVKPNERFPFVTVAGAVAVLYFAREILIPLALAALLSIIIGPLVRALELAGLRRLLAVLLTVMITFSVLSSLTWLMADQFIQVVSKLPQYRENIETRVQSIRGPVGAITARVTKTFQEFNTGSGAEKADQAVSPAEPNGGQPLAVKVVGSPGDIITTLQKFLGPVLQPLLTAGLVLIFTIFMLIGREDLRDRFIRLTAQKQISQVTMAIDDAMRRVTRYLLMQLLINSCYGVSMAAALYIIGVPNSALWGLLSTIFKFVPYLGVWLAAACPVLLSLAVFDGWTRPLLVVFSIVTIEVITSNAFEPLLYGASTGLTPIAVLGAATFWTWLWGAIGLLVSTPLTVCAAVLGRHVSAFKPLDILLSDRPVLDPWVKLYQRLLANDEDEALEVMEEHLNSGGKEKLYDTLLLPMLAQASADCAAGIIEEDQYQYICNTLRAFLDTFAESGESLEERVRTVEGTDVVNMVFVPMNRNGDEIAALIAADYIFTILKLNCSISKPGVSAGELSTLIRENASSFCLISSLAPLPLTALSAMSRRLRTNFPELTILIGAWHFSPATRLEQRFRRLGTTKVTNRVGEVEHLVAETLRVRRSPTNSNAPQKSGLPPPHLV